MKNTLTLIKGEKVVTDSLIIAEKFRKRHTNILEKIESLVRYDDEDRLNFRPISYKDSYGRIQKKYIMDRRSFSILCMSFTGKKALKWKNDFYDAFEQMENFILQQQNYSWQQARTDGKKDRYELTEAIKKLVEFAENSGSKNADRYYESISKMIYQKLFGITRVPLDFRDSLGHNSLKQLKNIEWQVSQWLTKAIETCNDYHEPYREIKEKLSILVSVVGVMSPYLQMEHKDL